MMERNGVRRTTNDSSAVASLFRHPEPAAPVTARGSRHADPFAAVQAIERPATARRSASAAPDIKSLLQPHNGSSIASRVLELREERLYRTRKSEPLGRCPAPAAPLPIDVTAPSFKGFGVATVVNPEDNARTSIHGAKPLSATEAFVEETRLPVGISAARVVRPGTRPRGTTFEGSRVDPVTHRFGVPGERGDSVSACFTGSAARNAGTVTAIIPKAVADTRVFQDSGTGGVAVGLSPMQRLARQVFCAPVQKLSSGTGDSLAAGRSTGRTKNDTNNGMAMILRHQDPPSRASSRTGRQQPVQQPPPTDIVFGAPTVRPMVRPHDAVSITDNRAFKSDQICAWDLIASKAEAHRSQPALTARELSRGEMNALWTRSLTRQERSDPVQFDAAWAAATQARGKSDTVTVADFCRACDKLDKADRR